MNSIELLEPRIAPAVVAMVSHGLLSILHTASSGADTLLVAETGPGKFAVSDTNTMAAYGTFENVTSIDIHLGETADSVTVQCGADGLAGKLKIATGDGVNFVSLSGGGVAGFIAGAVSVIGGADSDNVSLGSGLLLKKTLTIKGNGGTDYASGNTFTIAKKTTIDNVEQTTFESVLPAVFDILSIDQDEVSSA